MAYAENGSSLWLRYEQGNQSEIYSNKNTPTLQTAIQVLKEAWKGAPVTLTIRKNPSLKEDGFTIHTQKEKICITSPTDKGILYGAYHLLRLQSLNTPL